MRHTYTALLLGYLLSLSTCFALDSINYTCINQSYLAARPHKNSLNTDGLTYFAIPSFSQIAIQVDLRHLPSLQILTANKITFRLLITSTNNSSFTQTLRLSIDSNYYVFYASSNLTLSAYFWFQDTSKIYLRYLLQNSTSFSVSPADQSFLFQITSSDEINLPYNAVRNWVSNYSGYLISAQHQSLTATGSRLLSVISYNEYWLSQSFLVMPYIPYLSNCMNQSDYIFFKQLMSNPKKCQLYNESEIIPINQFAFGSAAVGDSCKISRHCVYDQVANVTTEYPYWNTLPAGSSNVQPVFTMSASEITGSAYSPTSPLDSTITCNVIESAVSNSSNKFPMNVQIQFGYYQVSSTQRRMITCDVTFSEYVASSAANFTYQLQLTYAPLTHTKILLSFGFNWYIYMIVFIIIGLISNVEYIIFWLYHYIVSSHSRKPFRVRIYLQMLREIIWGALLASVILLAFTVVVEIVMNGQFFGNNIFGNAAVSLWDYLVTERDQIGIMAQTQADSIRGGRIGLSYIIIGAWLAIELSGHLIGKQKSKQHYEQYEILGRTFSPSEWSRGKLLIGTMFMLTISILFIYFAYSSLYANNIWTFIVVLKVVQMIIQEISYSIYDDVLPCLSFKIILNIVSYLNTLSALDLYQFLLGYLIDLSINMIQVAYISQLQQSITDFIEEKIEEITRWYIALMNDDEEEDNKSKEEPVDDQPNNQNVLIQDILLEVDIFAAYTQERHYKDSEIDFAREEPTPEQIILRKQLLVYLQDRLKEHKSKRHFMQQHEKHAEPFEDSIFQIILDNVIDYLSFLLQPVVVLMFWMTYYDSNVFILYGINYATVNLYFLSAIVIAIFSVLNLILSFYTLEAYLGIDYSKPIRDLLDRFQARKVFWVADEKYDEEQMKVRLKNKLRGADKYCISSQFYFVLATYTGTIVLVIVGIATIINNLYNPFKDIFIFVIALFWIIIIKLGTSFLKFVMVRFNLWDCKAFNKEDEFGNRMKVDETLVDQQMTQQILKINNNSEVNILAFRNQSSDFFISKNAQADSKTCSKHNLEIFGPQNKNVEQLLLEVDEAAESKMQAEDKLRTICRKLEPEFEDEDFRIQFTLKNKEYIKKNLQKILPLVESFPERKNFFMEASQKHQKGTLLKKTTQNTDPFVAQLLLKWLRATEVVRQRKRTQGINLQSKLKKCNFCFKTWSIYYGYEGICFDCSKKLIGDEKQK